ncbi:hypothetical protein, partial [Sphingomonas sp. CCH18-B1]|uniref:hypothetical protein n=1 Tax=Sphingomonas sp. CCH18-B1 TaxID=1768744 RepID=UPI001E4532EE
QAPPAKASRSTAQGDRAKRQRPWAKKVDTTLLATSLKLTPYYPPFYSVCKPKIFILYFNKWRNLVCRKTNDHQQTHHP